MRQRENKALEEILKRSREGNHKKGDLLKIEERLATENSSTYPLDAPKDRFFMKKLCAL